MKTAILLSLLPSIISISTAGLMAFHDKPGWGWFLAVGIVLGNVSYRSSNSTSKKS